LDFVGVEFGPFPYECDVAVNIVCELRFTLWFSEVRCELAIILWQCEFMSHGAHRWRHMSYDPTWQTE